MPGPPQRVLTPRDARRLQVATRKIKEAELAWAELVAELGIAASARELGLTPQAVGERVRRLLRRP